MVEKTNLKSEQLAVVERPISGSVFLEGAAGSGKTTVGIHRLLFLLESGVPANEILVIVPQRALEYPYVDALRQADLPPGGQVTVTTLSALAVETVQLFWSLAAPKIGFMPDQQPTILTLETAQYIMARIVDPLILEHGYFDAITIDRNRLYSQILDNLNKAAVVGFNFTEISQRLKDAWLGESAQFKTFDQVQECAELFRRYCIDHSLLDFSLQIESFRQLWEVRQVREYLLARYAHLIVDNAEEENPAFIDMLVDWLPDADSALILYDTNGGFRSFLGADPEHARFSFTQQADDYIQFSESFVNTPELDALANEFARQMQPDDYLKTDVDPRAALEYRDHRYYPEMLNWIADEIRYLVTEKHIPPGEIVVLAPFLSDALRFSLITRLEGLGIAARSHRPSRALREEPAARCLLTLAQLAHPQWNLKPTRFDVAYALMLSISSMDAGKTLDLVRAQLLAEAAYPHVESKSGLAPFEVLPIEVQERVSYLIGERYDALRLWIEGYIADHPVPEPPPPPPPDAPKRRRKKKAEAEAPPIPEIELDHFFSLIFGEVLSQIGFGMYGDFEAARVTTNLIDSARSFRRSLGGIIPAGKPSGAEYIEMVSGGLIAAQYVRRWQTNAEDSVLIAPAYTFLMNNQPATVQFWLDIGNRGWFERLYQPLTHPYVLSRWWKPGDKWTDEQEVGIRRETLYRLMIGLIRRCRGTIYLGLSQLSENGYESQGELLQAIQRMLRRLGRDQAHGDV
ncbi:MAG: ATP-dependent helicase [Anaerolineae bacterium]|nr:ATP-dependent helicase [Anaerolineae bacterium]